MMKKPVTVCVSRDLELIGTNAMALSKEGLLTRVTPRSEAGTYTIAVRRSDAKRAQRVIGARAPAGAAA